MLNSSIRKVSTLVVDGVEPYEVGKHNFENPTIEFETLSEVRAEVCKDCRYFRIEPIDFLRIIDLRTPILSEMMCGKCGCSLPYKTRQNIKTCSKWKKQ